MKEVFKAMLWWSVPLIGWLKSFIGCFLGCFIGTAISYAWLMQTLKGIV